MNEDDMSELETLQLQRSMFAWLSLAFAEDSRECMEAVESLDTTQWVIQNGRDALQVWGGDVIDVNVGTLRRLTSALIAMPQAAYEAVDGGL